LASSAVIGIGGILHAVEDSAGDIATALYGEGNAVEDVPINKANGTEDDAFGKGD
jgi:hypothetical protein